MTNAELFIQTYNEECKKYRGASSLRIKNVAEAAHLLTVVRRNVGFVETDTCNRLGIAPTSEAILAFCKGGAK